MEAFNKIKYNANDVVDNKQKEANDAINQQTTEFNSFVDKVKEQNNARVFKYFNEIN